MLAIQAWQRPLRQGTEGLSGPVTNGLTVRQSGVTLIPLVPVYTQHFSGSQVGVRQALRAGWGWGTRM